MRYTCTRYVWQEGLSYLKWEDSVAKRSVEGECLGDWTCIAKALSGVTLL